MNINYFMTIYLCFEDKIINAKYFYLFSLLKKKKVLVLHKLKYIFK